MSLLRKSIATAQLDLVRSIQPSRLSVAAVLILFPPVMTLVVSGTPGDDILIPVLGVTTLMSGLLAVLLWATPIVYQELESKTWGYIAVRKDGKLALLIGRYFMASLWTFIVCTIAMTLGLGIIVWFDPLRDSLQVWLTFLGLILLASLSYCGIFLLIGVVVPRRAMVFAVAYMIIVEGILASFPVVLNQATMRHHLVALGIKSLDFPVPAAEELAVQQIFGLTDSSLQNLLILLICPAICFAITTYIILTREYITDEES